MTEALTTLADELLSDSDTEVVYDPGTRCERPLSPPFWDTMKATCLISRLSAGSRRLLFGFPVQQLSRNASFAPNELPGIVCNHWSRFCSGMKQCQAGSRRLLFGFPVQQVSRYASYSPPFWDTMKATCLFSRLLAGSRRLLFGFPVQQVSRYASFAPKELPGIVCNHWSRFCSGMKQWQAGSRRLLFGFPVQQVLGY